VGVYHCISDAGVAKQFGNSYQIFSALSAIAY